MRFGSEDLYEITRGEWSVNRCRAKNEKYTFVSYKGVIRQVYESNGVSRFKWKGLS